VSRVPEPLLEYDNATHTYKVDGVVYPSVTQVLREAGLIDDTWFTEEGAERGKEVALITELYDKGELDEALLTKTRPQYMGYLEAWKKFLRERVFVVVTIEERLYEHAYCYAGTSDRRVSLIDGTGRTLVEIKTGAKAWWHRYQTAAYMAVRGALNRMAVYLKPDGKYTCDPHDDYPHDIDVFRAALCIANEKRAYGKTGDRYGG